MIVASPPPAAFQVKAPVIASLTPAQLPVVPAGLAYGTVLGPDVAELSPRSPVLRFAGCTYWVFSFADRREAMAIVAYTPGGVRRHCWVREGARNLWDITVDAVTRTVTFYGQRRQSTREPGTITMGWDELVPLQPIVSRRPRTQQPPLPPELVYAARADADCTEESPVCPVLRFGQHTYWPFSFGDRRLATGIVACDAAGRPVSRWDCEGARDIWQITSDPVTQTVTFHGQRLNATREPGTFSLGWDELWLG